MMMMTIMMLIFNEGAQLATTAVSVGIVQWGPHRKNLRELQTEYGRVTFLTQHQLLPGFKFSLHHHPYIKSKRHENKENDHPFKMLQIVKNIPLVSTTGNVKRTVGRIYDFLMNTSLRE